MLKLKYESFATALQLNAELHEHLYDDETRNISKPNLFSSTSDLFTGKATLWIRQVKSFISN